MKKILLYLTITLSINSHANTFTQYQKECEANDGKGCHNFAVLYYQKGDFITALKYSDKSCNLGYVQGCVGAALVAKTLNKIDKQEKYLIKACDEFDSGLACGVLGFLYANRGEKTKALPRLYKACYFATDKSLQYHEKVRADNCNKFNDLSKK